MRSENAPAGNEVEYSTSVVTVRGRLKACAASRFIRSVAADHHSLGIGMEPLRAVRRSTAANTDGKRFCNVFRHGEQLRHGIEWPGPGVLIEPGNDHTLSRIRHL